MRGCCRERQCMEKQTRARERGKTGGHFAQKCPEVPRWNSQEMPLFLLLQRASLSEGSLHACF